MFVVRTVVGYHGTNRSAARKIVGGEPFWISRNAYDWLGDGVYFWEYGPYRAMEWATATYGPQAAVVAAKIRLVDCLDLTDLKGTRALRQANLDYVKRMAALGIKPARQQGGFRGFDRQTVNFMAETLHRIRVVRAAFVEGQQLWEDSGFWEHTHVQIAVRDTRLISGIRVVEDMDNESF